MKWLVQHLQEKFDHARANVAVVQIETKAPHEILTQLTACDLLIGKHSGKVVSRYAGSGTRIEPI